MRACAGGHTELSQLLFKQNPKGLRMINFYGETCLDLAGRSPNPQLVETLEALEREDGGSAAGCFGGKMFNPSSPAKKRTNEFAKPTALTLRWDMATSFYLSYFYDTIFLLSSLTLSLSHTHTHTHTHFIFLSLSFSLSHSLSLSFHDHIP